MVSEKRWKAAQKYEARFWTSAGAEITAGSMPQLDWYGWRAEQLRERLQRLGLSSLTDGSARVVEIGGGPVGVVSYFPATMSLAVDPLNESFAADPVLASLRNADVTYVTGVGESIPAESGTFDLAIIENCIDHVQRPLAVMADLRRVLRDQGILYLTVNCRSRGGYVVHRALSRLKIDAGHPHTFTPERATQLMVSAGFEPLEVTELESYAHARQVDLRSDSLKARLKGLLGISEFPISIVARKAAVSGRD